MHTFSMIMLQSVHNLISAKFLYNSGTTPISGEKLAAERSSFTQSYSEFQPRRYRSFTISPLFCLWYFLSIQITSCRSFHAATGGFCLRQYRTFVGSAGDAFSAICFLQKSRFTSSKPSISAIASDEKCIRHRANSFVQYCLNCSFLWGFSPHPCFVFRTESISYRKRVLQ